MNSASTPAPDVLSQPRRKPRGILAYQNAARRAKPSKTVQRLAAIRIPSGVRKPTDTKWISYGIL
jgi:hypothetical protein